MDNEIVEVSIERIEECNGLLYFQTTGDLDTFEKLYMPLLAYYGVTDEKMQRNLASSIWLALSEQWTKGKEWAESQVW